MRWLLLLPLAGCAMNAPPPRAIPPQVACATPATPPPTPAPPRTIERLAHFAVVLELSREEANAALVDCAAKLSRLQHWIEDH